MLLPDYVCAIIEDAGGRILLELRPPGKRIAGERMTCFGGAREAGESVAACLRRELHEELDVALRPIGTACALRDGNRLIALFYRCPWDPGQRLRTEPGVVAVWAPWAALPGLPLSPWHGAVLAAVAGGRSSVEAADTGDCPPRSRSRLPP